MVDRSEFKPTSLLYICKEIFNEEIDYFQKYIIESLLQVQNKSN
jgi:hypothetical protein